MEERIAKILNEWKVESGLNEIIRFKYNYQTQTLIIYTARPGFMVGRAGVTINKYKEILKDEVYGFENIEFVEVSSYGA